MFDSFYNDCIKKNTIAFASLFNNIYVNREDDSDSKKIKVPLVYGGKEKYISRLQNPSSISEKDKLQITLPMMSFDMSNLQYDTQRHRNKLEFNKLFYQEDGETKAKIKIGEYPCLMQFNLTVYTRNIEENFQIIEQIAPYFTPEYILTMDFDKTLTRGIDVPINLVASKIGNDYEGGFGNRRTVVSTLQFVMRSYLFGPEREATPILTTDFNLNTQDSFLQFITDVQTNDDLYLNNQSITVTWRQGGIFPRNPTIVITNLTDYTQEIVYDPETFDVGDGTNSVTFAIPASAPLLEQLYVKVFLGTVSDNSSAFEIRSATGNISQLVLANYSGTTFDKLMSSNHYFFTKSGVTNFARGNNLQLAFDYTWPDQLIKTPDLVQYFYDYGLTFAANAIANPAIPNGSVLHGGAWAGVSYDKNRILPVWAVFVRPGDSVSLYNGGTIGQTSGSLANRRTGADLVNATYVDDAYFKNWFWGYNGTTSYIITDSGAGSTLYIESGFSGYINKQLNQARYPETGKYSGGITNSNTTPSYRSLFNSAFTNKLYPAGATGYRALLTTGFGPFQNNDKLLFDTNIVLNSAFPVISAGADPTADKLRLMMYMDAYTIVHSGNTYLLPSPFTPNLVTDMVGYTAYKPTGFTGRYEYQGKFGSTYTGMWNAFFDFIAAGVTIDGQGFTLPTPYFDYIWCDHEHTHGYSQVCDLTFMMKLMRLVTGLTTTWINQVKQDEFWPNLQAKYNAYPGLSFDRIFETKNAFIRYTSGSATTKGPQDAQSLTIDALPLMEFYDEERKKLWLGCQNVVAARNPGCKFFPLHVNRVPRNKDAYEYFDLAAMSFTQGITVPYTIIHHYSYSNPITPEGMAQGTYKSTGYGPNVPNNIFGTQNIGSSVTLGQVNSAADRLTPWFTSLTLGQTGTTYPYGLSLNQEYFSYNSWPTVGNGVIISFTNSSTAEKGTKLAEKYEPFFALKNEARQMRGLFEENYANGVSGIAIFNTQLFNRASYFQSHGIENCWFFDGLTADTFNYTDAAIFSKTNFSSSPVSRSNRQPINFYHNYHENTIISKLLAGNMPSHTLALSTLTKSVYTNLFDSFGQHTKNFNNFKYNDVIFQNNTFWDVEVATHGRTVTFLSTYDDIDKVECVSIERNGPFTVDKLNPPLVSKARLQSSGAGDQNLILHRITLPIPYILTNDYGKAEQDTYYDNWYNNNLAQKVLASSVNSSGVTLDDIYDITTGNRDLDFYTKKKVTKTVGSHTWTTLETDPTIKRFSVDVYAGNVLLGNLKPSKYYPMGVWLVTDEESLLPDGTTFNNYNLTFSYKDDGPITNGITTAQFRT
jgi:hypothetical protein